MARQIEIEIKFRIEDMKALQRKLRAAGFRCVYPRRHEYNTLYDQPGEVLRSRGELLRLRKYGRSWVLTHKAKAAVGRHKSRIETETEVADGKSSGGNSYSSGFPSYLRLREVPGGVDGRNRARCSGSDSSGRYWRDRGAKPLD